MKIYGNGKLMIYAIFEAKKKRTKLRTMRNMITFQERHATKNDGIVQESCVNLHFLDEKKRTKLRTMRKIIIFQESHVCCDTKNEANFKRTNLSQMRKMIT